MGKVMHIAALDMAQYDDDDDDDVDDDSILAITFIMI